MKKIFLKIAVVILTIAFVASPATAQKIDITPTERFFVNDFAGVINPQAEDAIYHGGVQLYEKTKAQVVVVTIDTTGGKDIHEYALEVGRSWGIGDKQNNTGILLLLAVQDREVDISVGYGLEGAVTDAQSGILLDKYATPHFKNGDYSKGLAETYNALINEVYIEYDLEPDPNYIPVSELEENDGWLGIVIFLILLLIVLFSGRRRFPGFFFFPIGGFGGHHHGGGGFGGGSFRGGGGSFGGGGASRRF